jgi:hypothetical protein
VAWDVAVTGLPAAEILGVYLQLVDSTGGRRVLHRLVRPGALRGTGRGLLRPAERDALGNGKLSVRLVSRAMPTGREAVVALPSALRR